jgi:hypothetical protein
VNARVLRGSIGGAAVGVALFDQWFISSVAWVVWPPWREPERVRRLEELQGGALRRRVAVAGDVDVWVHQHQEPEQPQL